MATFVYDSGKAQLGGGINWASDSIRVALVGAGYTPSQSHQFMSQITDELTNGSYARKVLASKSVVFGGGLSNFIAGNPVWTALAGGEDIVRAIVYKHTGADSGNALIACIDVGSSTANGTDFLIRWNGTDTTGIVMRIRDLGSTSGAGYVAVQSQGLSLTQRTTLNITDDLKAEDDAGGTRTRIWIDRVSAGGGGTVAPISGPNTVALSTDGAAQTWGKVALAAMVSGILSIANGGTGLSTAGGTANRVMQTVDGTTLTMGQVSLTTMVSGVLPAGSGGTGLATLGSANDVYTVNAAGNAVQPRKAVDANIDPNAAIAGTKITPNFGTQDVVSTGNLLIGPTVRAGTGLIRVANGVTVLVARSGDGLSDLPLVRTDAANIQYFGAGSSGSIVVIDGGISAGVHLRTANANRLAINNGQMVVYVPIYFPGTITTPLVSITPEGGPGKQLAIRGQSGVNSGDNGSQLLLQGGSAVTTGLAGAIRMQLVRGADSTFETMFEVSEVAAGRRQWTLGLGANATATQFPANTGDRVGIIATAATEPTATGAGGALVWANAARALRTDVGIGLGFGAVAASGFIRVPNGVQTLMALRNDANTADHRLIRSDTTLGSTTITFGESSPNPVTSWDFHSTVRFNHSGVQMATIGSGGVVVNQVGLNFSKTYTTGSGATIFQQDIDTGSTINDMVVLAQGSVVAASNHNGGRILLAGGKPTGTGLPGRTQFALQRTLNTYEVLLEAVELAASRRVVAIGIGTATGITTTQMGANTGDRVVYLAQAATEPTANAVGGALVWANAANVLRTNVAIGIGFNAATHGMLRVPHNQVIFGGRNVTNTGNVTLIDWGVAGDSVLRIGNEIDTLRVGLTGGYRWDFGGATVEIRGGNGVLRWVDYEGAEIGPGGMNYTGGAFSGIGKGWFIQAQAGGAGSGFAGGGITLSAGSGGDNTASGGSVQINAGKAGGTGFGGGVHGRVEINCGTYDVGGGLCFSAWDSGTTGPAIRFYNHSGNHAPRATITGSRSGATVSVLQQLLVALGDLNGVNLVRDLTTA